MVAGRVSRVKSRGSRAKSRGSRVKSRGSNKVFKNHVIIQLFNIQYYIKFKIIFNIDILNEKLTADNNVRWLHSIGNGPARYVYPVALPHHLKPQRPMLELTFIKDIMFPVHSLPTFHFVFQQSKMIDRQLQMQMIITL